MSWGQRDFMVPGRSLAVGDRGMAATSHPAVTLAAVEDSWRRETEHRTRVRAKELDVARSIQQNLLPGAPPKMDGLEVYGRNLPADEIGGDYFDWLQLDDDHLAVVVGDISGHGIPAALLMAFLRASFHATAMPDRAPEDIVTAMNRSLACAASGQSLAARSSTPILRIVAASASKAARWSQPVPAKSSTAQPFPPKACARRNSVRKSVLPSPTAPTIPTPR